MKLTLAWTVALAAIISGAEAGAINPLASTTTLCATAYGFHRPPSVSTSKVRTTKTIKSTSTKVTTKITTTTPRPPTITKTTTSTSTVVEYTQFEDVYTTTVTDRSTSTSTYDTVTGVVATSTTVLTRVSTSTVPTTPGYTPLASTLPQPEDDGTDTSGSDDGSGDDGSDDGVDDGGDASKRGGSGSSWDKNGGNNQIWWGAGEPMPGWPQIVLCTISVRSTVVVQTNTIINSVTKTAILPTVTKTLTKSAVTTSTSLLSPAKTTVTKHVKKYYTSTYTNIATSTSTHLVRQTVYTATSTAYAACATDNVMSDLNGNGFVGITNRLSNFSFSTETLPADTGLDCCNLAAQRPNAWYYQFSVINGAGTCQIMYSSESCPVPDDDTDGQSKYAIATALTAVGPAQSPMTIGNGPCGPIDSVMPAPTVF